MAASGTAELTTPLIHPIFFLQQKVKKMETTILKEKEPEDKKEETHIVVYCNCGEMYTVEQNGFLVCPQCHHPPQFIWSQRNKAYKFFGMCDYVVHIQELPTA